MAKKLARKTTKKKAARATKPVTRKGKYVYVFGRKTDGNGSMKPLLGGKGANLAEMCRIGLPVPPGFTITTEVCTYYYANKRTYPPTLRKEMESGVASLEQQTGKKFGDLKNPLLVSVRSGARDSMPGMMDTILNLGLNDQTVEALAAKTGNRALRLGLLPPLRPDVRRRRARRAEARGRGSRSVRDGHSRSQARALSPGHRRHQADRRRSQGAGRALQGPGEGTGRQAVPELALGPAARRRRRGLRIVDERPGDRLPPQVQHSRPSGAPPSTSRRWSTATPATTRVPASRSRATRPTASRSSTASS